MNDLSAVVTQERGGAIQVSVLPVGAELSGSRAEARGHTVNVRLTPLLSREEMRSLLAQDPEFQEAIQRFSRTGLTRELESE